MMYLLGSSQAELSSLRFLPRSWVARFELSRGQGFSLVFLGRWSKPKCWNLPLPLLLSGATGATASRRCFHLERGSVWLHLTLALTERSGSDHRSLGAWTSEHVCLFLKVPACGVGGGGEYLLQDLSKSRFATLDMAVSRQGRTFVFSLGENIFPTAKRGLAQGLGLSCTLGAL